MNASIILELDDVSLEPRAPGTSQRPLSLRLAGGEWACLSASDPEEIQAWGDLILGLGSSGADRVSFLSRPWGRTSPDEQAALRAQIGRVFAATAWLANLDVDENVLLAALYHTRRPVLEWRRAAEKLAQRVGLDGLPTGRPVLASPDTLQRAQWVRALLRRPRLLVLERPLRSVPDEAAVRLGEVLEEALAGGAAMVWLSLDGDPRPPTALRPPVVDVKL